MVNNTNWDNIKELCGDLQGDYQQDWYGDVMIGDERCELDHPDGEIVVATHDNGQLLVEFPGGRSNLVSGFDEAHLSGGPNSDQRDDGNRTLRVTGKSSEDGMSPGDMVEIEDYLLPEALGTNITIDSDDDVVRVGRIPVHNLGDETTLEFANGMKIEGELESDGWKFDTEQVPGGCEIAWGRGDRSMIDEDDSATLSIECDEDIGGFRIE